MRGIIVIITSFIFSPALAMESGVYVCRNHQYSTNTPVRMKTYHDPALQIELGKVDRIDGDEVLRSTATKVIRVPLLDRASFVQIWYGEDVILNAQLEYDQGGRPFQATYKSAQEKIDLLCHRILD